MLPRLKVCDRFPESIPNTDLLLVSVQNGSIHQKDAVNDDDFEPYLSSQTNQVSEHYFLEFNFAIQWTPRPNLMLLSIAYLSEYLLKYNFISYHILNR